MATYVTEIRLRNEKDEVDLTLEGRGSNKRTSVLDALTRLNAEYDPCDGDVISIVKVQKES